MMLARRLVGRGLVAFVLGFLLARYRGIFFAMLEPGVLDDPVRPAGKTQALGSTDGFNVAARPCSAVAARPAGRATAVRAVRGGGRARRVAALRCTATCGRHWAALAPAIRDNEIRVEYMGASVRDVGAREVRDRRGAGGIGGALAALAVGHIDPEMAYWTTSGEFVFIAILAGTGSVVAPFLGALVFGSSSTVAYEHLAEHLADDPRHRAAGRHHVPARGAVVAVRAAQEERVTWPPSSKPGA